MADDTKNNMNLTEAPKKVTPENASKKAKALANELMPTNKDSVDNFGLDLQGYMKNLSVNQLNKVTVKNSGEIGEELTDLATKLSTNGMKPAKSFVGKLINHFKQVGITNYTRYQTADKAIDGVRQKLEKSQEKLSNNTKVIQAMREDNAEYCRTLTDYINAGQLRLDDVNNNTIPALQKKVDEAPEGSEEKQDAVNELQNWMDFSDTLSKRVYDLRLAQHISIQTEPQLRLIYLDTKQLISKIHESVDISIPIWQRQMQLQLQLQDLKQANGGVKAIQDATTHMMQANSNMVKEQSAETFKQANRGIVDEDTLQNSYQSIIDAVKACKQYQQEGQKKRADSEKHLQQMLHDYQRELASASGTNIGSTPELEDNGGDDNDEINYKRFDATKF